MDVRINLPGETLPVKAIFLCEDGTPEPFEHRVDDETCNCKVCDRKIRHIIYRDAA